MTADDRRVLEELWNEHAGSVYAFAVRRVGRSNAEDVVVEVFSIAWSRIPDIPPRRLPWLYGVAKNVIRQLHRGEGRQRRLESWLANNPVAGRQAVEDAVSDRVSVLHAIRALDETDQEALLLVAWEELNPRDAAAALGISSAAFRMRLTRARRRLRAEIDSQVGSVPVRKVPNES
jgi:RNA polymerase sigma-70 factor (ECF subfamily)